MLDKLEEKEKQPSSLLLKIDHLFFVFIILGDFLTMYLDHVRSQFLPLITRFSYPQICVFFYLLLNNTLSPVLFIFMCVYVYGRKLTKVCSVTQSPLVKKTDSPYPKAIHCLYHFSWRVRFMNPEPQPFW